MQIFIKTTLIIHIICGTIALFTGIGAILFRNKIKIHKPIGMVFYIAMTGIFTTSVILSIVKSYLFFFLIGFFTYHSALIGYRALNYKKLHMGQTVKRIDFIIEFIAGTINLGLIGYALFIFFKFNNYQALVPLVFGSIGLRGVIKNLLAFYKKNVEKSFWLQKHIGNMCGSYIGTITAFVVNMNKYWDLPQLLVWLGPTLIISPIIFMEVKKLKTKNKLVQSI